MGWIVCALVGGVALDSAITLFLSLCSIMLAIHEIYKIGTMENYKGIKPLI